MRIAHLICTFPPYRGGMGQVAYEEVKRLSDFGHDVTVFTLSGKDKLEKQNFEIKYLKPLLRYGHGGFYPAILWYLKNFDIIHLHYPFWGIQEVLWFGKKLGIIKGKLIITYHMDVTFKNPFLKLLLFKLKLFRKGILNSADKIITASLDYIKFSEIKKYYKSHQDKFVEIPFGTNQDIKKINSSKLQNLKQSINPKSKKLLLFVGSLDKAHYFKGVDVLLESITKLQDKSYKLIIVGGGDLRSQYESLSQKLGIREQVSFAGRLSNEDLSYYYAACDTLILPSVHSGEAFGLVVAEAKTFGKPAVTSDLPGVRAAVGDSGLTFKTGDPDSLAKRIKFLFDTPELYSTLSQKALEETKEKFNWQTHTKQLDKIYQK